MNPGLHEFFCEILTTETRDPCEIFTFFMNIFKVANYENNMLFATKSIKVYFLRKEHGTYHLKRVKKLSETKQLISYKNREYKLNLTQPLYKSGKYTLYFMDMDSGDQLTFNVVESQANPDDLDIIVGQRIIRELTKGVIDNKSQLLFYTIVGLAIGALLMGFILSMYYNDKISKIYKEVSKQEEEPQEIIPTMSTMIKTWRML